MLLIISPLVRYTRRNPPAVKQDARCRDQVDAFINNLDALMVLRTAETSAKQQANVGLLNQCFDEIRHGRLDAPGGLLDVVECAPPPSHVLMSTTK